MDQAQSQTRMPMASQLLHQTLRALCTDSPWLYAVFWRIVPRNFPPPKWETVGGGGGMPDRSKANKRNWILVWEDGYCDFEAITSNSNEEEEGLQPRLFFKMSHEVYNYGEGIVGKVAADTGHKWVYRDPPQMPAVAYPSPPLSQAPWQNAIDPLPRIWEAQFKSGIQTIVLIAVREGVVQLGSTNKVSEDMNVVMELQSNLHFLQTIPFLPSSSTTPAFPLPLVQEQPGLDQLYWNTYNPIASPLPFATGIDDSRNLAGKEEGSLERCLSWYARISTNETNTDTNTNMIMNTITNTNTNPTYHPLQYEQQHALFGNPPPPPPPLINAHAHPSSHTDFLNPPPLLSALRQHPRQSLQHAPGAPAHCRAYYPANVANTTLEADLDPARLPPNTNTNMGTNVNANANTECIVTYVPSASNNARYLDSFTTLPLPGTLHDLELPKTGK